MTQETEGARRADKVRTYGPFPHSASLLNTKTALIFRTRMHTRSGGAGERRRLRVLLSSLVDEVPV